MEIRGKRAAVGRREWPKYRDLVLSGHQVWEAIMHGGHHWEEQFCYLVTSCLTGTGAILVWLDINSSGNGVMA